MGRLINSISIYAFRYQNISSQNKNSISQESRSIYFLLGNRSPCRLDTFPTMVANRPVMYNRVPPFGLLNSTLSAGESIHKSQIGTSCLYQLQID